MYRLEVAPRAQKDLKNLDRSNLKRIDAALIKLEQIPFPPGVKHLIARDTAQYRVRVGDYRILYDVDEKAKVVIILRVGHRRDIYR